MYPVTNPSARALDLGCTNTVNNGVTGDRKENEGASGASRGTNCAYNAQKLQSDGSVVPVSPCPSPHLSACCTWECKAEISGILTTATTTPSVTAQRNHRDI